MPAPGRLRKLRSFALRLPFAFLAALFVWLTIAPAYGKLCGHLGVALVRLFESPDMTRYQIGGLAAGRTPGAADDSDVLYFWPQSMHTRSSAPSLELRDVHFSLVILLALFWATPGAGEGRAWKALGISVAALLFVHAIEVFFVIQSTYALRMGPWSAANYSVTERNVYAFGKHFLDLSLKFAAPFVLWAYFSLRTVLGGSEKAEKA